MKNFMKKLALFVVLVGLSTVLQATSFNAWDMNALYNILKSSEQHKVNRSGVYSSDVNYWLQDGDLIELRASFALTNRIQITKKIKLGSSQGAWTLSRGNAGYDITVASTGALSLMTNTTLDGGGLEGTRAFIVVNEGGVFEMQDGAVVQNCKRRDSGGATILVAGGTVTMNGGTIKNCHTVGKPRAGAAVMIDTGTMTMNGGTITECSASNEGSAIAVGHWTEDNKAYVAKLYLKGGSITGNNAATSNEKNTGNSCGGAVTLLNGWSYIFLSGSPVVRGNTFKTANGDASNISFYNPAWFSNLVQDGDLTSDAEVGVSFPTTGSTAADASAKQFGTAMTAGLTGADRVFWDRNTSVKGEQSGTTLVWHDLSPAPVDPVCRLLSNEKTYATLAEAYAAAQATDTIELLKNIDLSGTAALELAKNITLTSAEGQVYSVTRTNANQSFVVPSGKALTLGNVTLDGNGANVTSESAFLSIGGALVINDGTTIENVKRREGDGAAIIVAGGAVTMNGGTIRNCAVLDLWSGGAVLVSSGSMTMNGGTITGCSAGHEGGAIVVGQWDTANEAKLYLRGGTITGNTSCTLATYSSAGGAVCLLTSGAYVYVSGNPVVAGNTLGTSTGSANDIAFYDASWVDHLVLEDALGSTASLGVALPTTGTTPEVASHQQFGVAATTGLAGAGRFFWNGNQDVTGVLYGTRLVWALADPVCRLESTGLTYASLAEAFAEAEATDTVYLLKNLAFEGTAAVTCAKNLTLTSDGGHTNTLTRTGAEQAFVVPSGLTLTLGNIVVDGGSGVAATGPMFTVQAGATLAVTAGTTIKNCKNAATDGKGGAIYAAADATVNLQGGTITGCSAAAGGAVYLDERSDAQNYTYYRFTFKGVNESNELLQMSELNLYAGETRINAGTYTVVARNTAPSSLQEREVVLTTNVRNPYPNNEGPANLFDGNTATKFCTSQAGKPANGAVAVAFRLPDGTSAATGYSFTTANDETPARNPANWVVEGSVDGTNWVTLDEKSGQGATPTTTYTEGTRYTFATAASTMTRVSATLNVSGAPRVTANTLQNGTTQSNVQPTSAAQVTLAGAFTGRVGVSYPATGTVEGAAFGVAGSGSGAEKFFYDGSTEYQGLALDGKLVWAKAAIVYNPAKSIADQIAGATQDPVVIELSASATAADGTLVIPAGKNVVIDLKGNTLTANIVAEGSVTITDSTAAKTGKLDGTLTQSEGGAIALEWGTYTTEPQDAWLAANRIVIVNANGTYLVTQSVGSSAVTGVSLDTRRGVRLVESPADVLPLTYASKDWVYNASKDKSFSSTLKLADAIPGVDGDFANAAWHDGMTDNATAPGDRSYDYPSGNKNILAAAGRTLYQGPGEGEIVWQEECAGLVETVLTTATGTLRAWYKFPEVLLDIVPGMPGDPAKVKNPETTTDEEIAAMNTLGDATSPGYTVTNDAKRPWNAVYDPINPYTVDPEDPTNEAKWTYNYVAQAPRVADPSATSTAITLAVVGPGTLTWNDLIVGASGSNDATLTVSIDGGDPITIHTGEMSAWAHEEVVFGGDTDTPHTVVITFQGNTSDASRGYVDGVVWTPATLATKSDVSAAGSADFTFANLGTEPTAERKGETIFSSANGSETPTVMVLDTVSTVDTNGKQLTSKVAQEGDVTESSTGTEDYWYAAQDPGKNNVANNTVAVTPSTLSANEAVTLTVTDVTGPAKVSWDMLITDDLAAETDSYLQVVVTKHERDAQGNAVIDPATGLEKVTTTTTTYTAAQIAAWTDGALALGGPADYAGNGAYTSAATYDIAFTYVNNSDGTGTAKLDNISVVKPDLNIAPELNDGANHAAAGSKYTGEVNSATDASYPGYTVTNDRANPWEVVTDPKAGTTGASGTSGSTQTSDKVAMTPNSLAPGESTTLKFTVQGDGEFSWKSLVDTTTGEGKTPAQVKVYVDGKEVEANLNQVYGAEGAWTEHTVHVTDKTVTNADGTTTVVDNGTHTIEIVFVNDNDAGTSKMYLDDATFTPRATVDELYQIVGTNPATRPTEVRQTISIVNDPASGWMPIYTTDAEGRTVVAGVRSADGTEGTTARTTDEDGNVVPGTTLESTFTVGVTGPGEVKVGTIVIPSTTDTTKNGDHGALTIMVDGQEFVIPAEPTADVSFTKTVDPETGAITITDLVIKVGGDYETAHTVAFTYTRDANDPTGNTAAVVKNITWTETVQDIIPVLPGDPAKVKAPGTDGTAMNTPGNADYPGYTTTNDPANPWRVVEDPLNPGNYVAETPRVSDPANTAEQVTLQVVGPGTLVWQDLVRDGSIANDATMTVSIDGGAPITVHTGNLDVWVNEQVVFGGDVDTVHTVVISFKGNSTGDTANQAHGYVDGVVWTPKTLATTDDVKAATSRDFTLANLGTVPAAEHAGDTLFYANGATTPTVLDTVSTVDANGKQLTSTVVAASAVTDATTGTEDYWYAVVAASPESATGNTVAQTAPTLSANEKTSFTVTGVTGPAKVSWDMLIDDGAAAEGKTPSKLEVVVTKYWTDAQGNPVIDPETGKQKVTTTTYTYTAGDEATWQDGALAFGEAGAAYDLTFTYTNNSTGDGVCSIDNLSWTRPDINVGPIVNDGANASEAGSDYGRVSWDPDYDATIHAGQNVNASTDSHYAGYTVENEKKNPWEVVTDPKAGTDGASGSSGSPLATDKVAMTPNSLAPGESTTLTFTVQGDGEFSWKSLVDAESTDATPAQVKVYVDGKEVEANLNQVYGAEGAWTEHTVHVTDKTVTNADGTTSVVDGGTHTVEIVFVNDGNDGDSKMYLDDVVFTPSATREEMYAIVTTDPPPASATELQANISIVNGPESGWMPVWGTDENGNPTIVGVRSPDGTEGTTPRTTDGEGNTVPGSTLESKFTLGVTGTGEIKIGYIEIPVKSGDGSATEANPDRGALTITVDGRVFTIPPVPDETVSYDIREVDGKIIIENLVIKVTYGVTEGTGEGAQQTLTGETHTIVFTYTRDASDPDGNTAAVVKNITWKTYGESQQGGTTWLQGKALWIIDHEDPGDGFVYLAFEPELKVVEELNAWAKQSDENNMIRVKYGQSREAADACTPVVAHLSTKVGHEVRPTKVWIKVSLKDLNEVAVVQPVGYWRIYIDGPAIPLSTTPVVRAKAVAAKTVESTENISETTTENTPEAAENTLVATATATPNGAVSANTFGILKVESTTKSTMIAVPWTWYSKAEEDAGDIPVKKLVKTTNLSDGDLLYCWDTARGAYRIWELDDGEWALRTTLTVNASGTAESVGGMVPVDDVSIPRGHGMWLVRQPLPDGTLNTRPFWVYGQSVEEVVETEIAAPGVGQSVASTMLGNPYTHAVKLNELELVSGSIASADRIVYFTESGALRYLNYVPGKGWRMGEPKVINGRTYTVYSYNVSIQPGHAFWYDRRGSTPLVVRWPVQRVETTP